MPLEYNRPILRQSCSRNVKFPSLDYRPTILEIFCGKQRPLAIPDMENEDRSCNFALFSREEKRSKWQRTSSGSLVSLQLPLKEGLVALAAISHINYFCKYNKQQAHQQNAVHQSSSWQGLTAGL